MLVRRREGLSREAFERGWAGEIGPKVASHVPGIKRYVQNHLMQAQGRETPFDGVGELWIQHMDAWLRIVDFTASEKGREVVDVERRFIDRRNMIILLGEEKVLKE